MALNACSYCAHTWHPRGAPLAAKCPNCGRAGGVEFAVVQSATAAAQARAAAERRGYSAKTSQIRWLFVGVFALVAFAALATGAFGLFATSHSGAHRPPSGHAPPAHVKKHP